MLRKKSLKRLCLCYICLYFTVTANLSSKDSLQELSTFCHITGCDMHLRWRSSDSVRPQTATLTYYITQSLLRTCFKTARAKKEEPKAKCNSKTKSVRAENCSCAQNSHKFFETPFLPI